MSSKYNFRSDSIEVYKLNYDYKQTSFLHLEDYWFTFL